LISQAIAYNTCLKHVVLTLKDALSPISLNATLTHMEKTVYNLKRKITLRIRMHPVSSSKNRNNRTSSLAPNIFVYSWGCS
jgi:hypothetical protein